MKVAIPPSSRIPEISTSIGLPWSMATGLTHSPQPKQPKPFRHVFCRSLQP